MVENLTWTVSSGLEGLPFVLRWKLLLGRVVGGEEGRENFSKVGMRIEFMSTIDFVAGCDMGFLYQQ